MTHHYDMFERVITLSSYGYLEMLQVEGLAGQLDGSKMRSVAWMLFLDVVPKEQSEWAAALAKSRANYDATLKELITDPHAESAASEDLAKNNPLAIDDDAPWKKFFEDGEFRKKIDMDVKRTFPEIEFFRSDHVQESLINILFCYSRRFPELSYRQGMHELAAIIFLVVHQDRHQEEAVAAAAAAAAGAAEGAAAAEMHGKVKLVMDTSYIAHDVYERYYIADASSTWYLFFCVNWRTLVGCADPPPPVSCSKAPRFADLRLHIPMTRRNEQVRNVLSTHGHCKPVVYAAPGQSCKANIHVQTTTYEGHPLCR